VAILVCVGVPLGLVSFAGLVPGGGSVETCSGGDTWTTDASGLLLLPLLLLAPPWEGEEDCALCRLLAASSMSMPLRF
jgi:hypothetical protein